MPESNFMTLSRLAGSAACLLLVGLLGACTAPKFAPGTIETPVTGRPLPPPERRGEIGPLPADDGQALAMLLSYSQRLRGLGMEEMRREYILANQTYAKSRADENRLRLGLVLAAPNAAIRDDARAVTLFEGAIPERRGGALGQFVSLMQGLVGERNRQIHDEKSRAEALQQKLDALKAIEQSMSERDARNAGPRGREPGK